MQKTPVTIVLPYPDAEKAPYYAVHEDEVDFLSDSFSAERCTLCFAALELSRVLNLLGFPTVYMSADSGVPEGVHLTLRIQKDAMPFDRSCSYALLPEQGGLVLEGVSRVGTLYAAYAFLRLQGVRWYYPGSEGELIPKPSGILTLPDVAEHQTPAMFDGRGLDVFAPLKDSAQFLLWMARNRMNVCSYHALTRALAQKLGMLLRIGGHLFEPYLHPDVTLSDGRTIWDAHQEWYGLPEDGIRMKDTAQTIQFCVCQPSLIDYLADILIKRLRGEWRHLDRLDIWGFDTWGGACSCNACRAVGNGTDRTLYFLSALRKRLDCAGIHTALVACAYEGTDTMEAPSHPTPANLLSGDCVIHYPIHRCYAHDFDDPECATNAYYHRLLKDWLAQTPRLPCVMGEYYNVSKFEDLPLTFVQRMRHEIPLYAKMGMTSITYMHPPLYHWGFRAINHLLLAELSWNPDADTDALLSEYFARLYIPYADEVRKIYALVESASARVANYRTWHHSVLASLLRWDGSTTLPTLDLTGHFANTETLIACLRTDTDNRREALTRVEMLLRLRKRENAVSISPTTVNNPEELARLNRPDVLTARLAELRRALIYGTDELTLFTLTVICYDCLSHGKDFSIYWPELEAVCEHLESYYFPMGYVSREVEAFCHDAFTRTQLRGVVERLRRYLPDTACQ